MDDPSEAEIAWAAGFFEGEGYFSAMKRPLKDGTVRLYPYVGINNTDYDTLVRFAEIIGAGYVKTRKADSKFNAKPQWRWIVFKRAEVERVLRLLEPWLSPRRLTRAHELFDDRGNLNAPRAACRRGHPMTEENIYYWHGARHCRACMKVRAAARAA